MYKPTIIRTKSREEWLEKRGSGVGASEVGAILGLSHFDTPYSVWRRKVGLDGPQPENIAMMMGHLLEDVVAQRFAIETGYTIIKASAADIIYYDPAKEFMRVTPDRVVKTPEGKALLECKTTSKRIDENNIPYTFLCQVHYQMRVTGIHTCYLAWLINGRDFGYARVDYDEEFVRFVEDRITEFWTVNVQQNIAPDAISVEDVMTMHPVSEEGKEVEADDDALKDIQELARLSKIAKSTEESIREVKGRLQVYMDNSESLVSKGAVLATWKSGKGRASFDSKALQKDNPELYAKYYKEGKPSRTFLLKVGEE